jgi:hypothetical protein
VESSRICFHDDLAVFPDLPAVPNYMDIHVYASELPVSAIHVTANARAGLQLTVLNNGYRSWRGGHRRALRWLAFTLSCDDEA